MNGASNRLVDLTPEQRLRPIKHGPIHSTQSYGALSARQALVLALVAVIAFHLAYGFAFCSFLIAVYLYCLFGLARLNSGRQAFYVGLGVGLLTFAPQLGFFWNIFGAAAIALWMVLAFWTALFLSLARLCRVRLGKTAFVVLCPFLWTGLEYFRSELYYLRFSWLNVGFAFSSRLSWMPLHHLGVYGISFAMMAIIGCLNLVRPGAHAWTGFALLCLFAGLTILPSADKSAPIASAKQLIVAGVQLEFPSETEVLASLNRLVATHPETDLLVLSEYTFDGPVPERIKTWCRTHKRYLMVGAKAPASASDYYDTAFVVGPDGNIVFHQGKSVPIQFFKDGLPAREQRLWQSPRGKIGVCICYDLSYSRVTDELVRLGAQALIVPTMDIVDWGRHQHELHARVAPIRAAEYGIPVFRLASSGISQCVNQTGHTISSAPFPGDAATLVGALDLDGPGRLPWDRVIAPISVVITGLLVAGFVAIALREKLYSKNKPD